MLKKRRGQVDHSFILLTIAIMVICAFVGVFVTTQILKTDRTAKTKSEAVIDTVGPPLILNQLVAQKSSPRQLEYFFETVKLNHGYDEIRVQDISIVFSTRNHTIVYDYAEHINCSLDPARNNSLASISNDFNVNYFGAVDKLNPHYSDAEIGYITKDNSVKLCFRSPIPLAEDETINIKVLPQERGPLVIEVQTPYVFKTDFILLYPIVSMG